MAKRWCLRAGLAAGLIVVAGPRVHAVSITCPANIQAATPATACEVAVTYPPPAVSGGIPLPCTSPSGAVFPLGATQVSCGAIDVGPPPNVVSCSFQVTVNDLTPPSITCPPPDTTVNTEPGKCGATVAFEPSTLGDNCPGVTFATQPPSGFFLNPLPHTFTITATDGSGNTATCSFSAKAIDMEPPLLTCPASLEATLPPGQCTIRATYPELTPVENCDALPFPARFQPPSGTLFGVGTAIVTATARDSFGNASSCEIPFIVRFPNGVDCDADRCTDEGCTDNGVCTFIERAPTSPDAILCNIDNLRDVLSAEPAAQCQGKCLDRLERWLTKLADLIHDAQVGSPKKCRRRLGAMLRRAKALSGTVQRLAEAKKLDPTTRAQRVTSEAAALIVRGGVFASSYCPGS